MIEDSWKRTRKTMQLIRSIRHFQKYYKHKHLYNSITKIHQSSLSQFVPQSEPPTDLDIYSLQQFIDDSKRLLVFTGAGLSTESGIPDYRSEGVGQYARSTNRPVQYADFLKNADVRQRYWARNFVGWPRFSSFLPNISHKIFAEWENKNKVHWLVTQNVDALHHKAGSRRVTELHGCTHRVECLTCKELITRNRMQDLIVDLNPDWNEQSVEVAPDGDVNLTSDQVKNFMVPDCPECGGILKPRVTFFGDNVDRRTVKFVHSMLTQCDAILVAGSSLEVYSGYRFMIRARQIGTPIAILNIGATRADTMASLKISSQCGAILREIHVR